MAETRIGTRCVQAGYTPGNGEPRQIPLVQSICESGDEGEPAACNIDTATGQAFINLAQAVVTVVNRRNKEQEPTKIVKVKKN